MNRRHKHPIGRAEADATSLLTVGRSNSGLVFDKYSYEASRQQKGGDAKFYNRFQAKFLLDGKADPSARLQRLLRGYPGVAKYFDLVAASPLVLGMGASSVLNAGFLWDYTEGLPYIPGSSLKGLLRAWLEEWVGALEDARDWLGPPRPETAQDAAPDSAGALIAFNAYPVEEYALCVEGITPHHAAYHGDDKNELWPGDWEDPTPIQFLTVAKGSRFRFALALRSWLGAAADRQDGAAELDRAGEELKKALEFLGVGGRTSRGLGRFHPVERR